MNNQQKTWYICDPRKAYNCKKIPVSIMRRLLGQIAYLQAILIMLHAIQ